MKDAADLATKIAGVLAAILGTAGYVLVLGATILWIRLTDVNLPPEIPVSLASRGELIAMGAQAVAVWLVLLVALGGLTAWIVIGDPRRRRFGYTEAGLALAVTISTLLAWEGSDAWVIAPTVLAVGYTIWGAWRYWPSLDAVTAVMLPLATGVGLGVLLGLFDNRNGLATAAGAVFIFGVLVFVTPKLQKWRDRQETNRNKLAQLEEGDEGDGAPAALVTALEGSQRHRPPVVTWIGRLAAALLALLVLGIISVASQLDQDKNFHKALVSLKNGDCVEGTYVVRGSDELVIGDPNLEDRTSDDARIATIPTSEVLEVQVYGRDLNGVPLNPDELCDEYTNEVLIHPGKPSGEK